MHTFAQTSGTNDIVIENGDIKLAHGKEAYAIIIGDAMRTLKGELQLDVEAGIPYLETVFASPNFVTKWKAAVRRKLLSLPFVDGIVSFDAHVEGLSPNVVLKYTMRVSTNEGVVEVVNG